MADFNATIRTLEAQRRELLSQVGAIDRAISALKGTDRPLGGGVPHEVPVTKVPARRPRKKRTFTLSDEHKRKLVEGRRRARQARTAPGEASNGDAAGWTGDGAPRLVRKEP